MQSRRFFDLIATGDLSDETTFDLPSIAMGDRLAPP
jgi:hypothetical protein